MKVKLNVGICLLEIVLTATGTWAQTGRPSIKATLDPCPGGTGSAIVDPVEPPHTLANLVRRSDLIIVGHVVQGLPAVLASPDKRMSIETHSLIQVDQVLLGLVSGTIALVQMGGEVPPCKLKVGADPIVNVGEQYVLFLKQDDRNAPANTSGSPRFLSVGVWSGKVRVLDGKVQFPPAASKGLHTHDNTDLKAFITMINNLTRPRVPPSPQFPPPLPTPPPPFRRAQ